MSRNVHPTQTTKQRQRKLFRRQLILPAEHGSWSWLLVPYFVGVLVAGEWNWPALLVLTGGLAGFLMRQPTSIYMRVRAGRGRRSDGALAAGWTLLFAAIALASLAGLLALGRLKLLWLLLPMAVIFVFYIVAARQPRASTRTLWMELAGAAGLAAMAPAAYIAAADSLDNTAWAIWSLMAGQNVLGVLYVRLRIADSHGRPVNRASVLWLHCIVLAAVIIAAGLEAVPWLAIAPFVGFLGRAAWAVLAERPVANIKRFGFGEIGVEVLGGILIAAGWLLR